MRARVATVPSLVTMQVRSMKPLRVLPSLVAALARAAACLAPAACDRAPSPAPPASSAALHPTPPPERTVAPAVLAPPADLDVDALAKGIGCPNAKGAHACRILSEFAQAARWSGETPSGEGRWFGNAYTLSKGGEKTEPVILLAKRAPTSQIGPADLPIRVAIGSLPESTWHDAAKLIRALQSSSNVSWHNPSVKYVREFSSTTDRGVVRSAGASVRLISDESTYLRQGTGRKVLMVRMAASAAAAPGEGTYAELWATTW
jgi:hypothetical protein